MSGFHRLPPNILDSLRGGGDRVERELWRAAHVSKRMAQLRVILDLAGDNTVLRQNFQALADVQRHDPPRVAELLGGPQVGAWAAHCLRLLSRNESNVLPHLAHLGAIAATAAMRTGAHVRVVVPVRAGAVYFPSVGRALLTGSEDGLAECVAGPDGVLINGVIPTTWHRVRLLRTEWLTVQIDDIDPYWSVFGMPVAPLTDDDTAAWQRQLDGAWRVLTDRHAHRVDTITGAVRCLVPIRPTGNLGGASASSADAPGAVALTEPTSPLRFAATLVHESQHYRLATLHDLHRLFPDSSGHLTYSPWRNDPRPPAGLLHALMAFTGVADFWSRERTGPASELEYTRLATQLRVAHAVATTTPDLTPLGAALVDALGDTITELPLHTGSEEVRRIADDLVAEHHAYWRLRNVVPDETLVRATARAWARGEPLPDTTPPHADDVKPAEPGGDHPLMRIAMAWLTNPAGLRLDEKRFPGAVSGDLHLVAADYTAVREDALDRIAHGSADDHAWARLAVAHGRACVAPSPLRDRPELVRAAFARLAPAGPAALRELMSRYEAGTSMSDTMRR